MKFYPFDLKILSHVRKMLHIWNNLNLDHLIIKAIFKHIHNLVKFYLFVLKILSRKLMTEGQNDGIMHAKPKSNISKWGFITKYVSVLIIIKGDNQIWIRDWKPFLARFHFWIPSRGVQPCSHMTHILELICMPTKYH